MASLQEVISPFACSQLSSISSLDRWFRCFLSPTGASFKVKHSVGCYSLGAGLTCQKDEDDRKKMFIESLWREFFSDPSLWSDHRSEKENVRYPDFKHKKKKQLALWLGNSLTPPWVEAELAAMPPGTVQENVFSWNKRLERCWKAGEYEETIQLFKKMQREGIDPDNFTFIPVLNACSRAGALDHGERIHEEIIRTGHESDLYVGNGLVDMYSKCGSVENARRVFDQMPSRDVVTWTSMIMGHVKCGEGQEALELFRRMQEGGVDPDHVTFVGVLNACASLATLEEGRHVHEKIIERGYENVEYVGTCLVQMYVKCGSMEDAQTAFNKMPTRGVVAWSALITGYAKCGEGKEALKLFQQMQQEGVDPDPRTFVGVLNACASIAALEEGRFVHEQIIERGCESDVFVCSCLVDMYAKCGSIEDARAVFDKMPSRDVVAWSVMIQGCVECGEGQEALELFGRMRQEGVDPDPGTFSGVLNACGSIAALEEGMCIHEEIIVRGYESHVYVNSCLIGMYAKCGRIEDARRLLKKMPTRDAVSWTAVMMEYVKCGEGQEALEVFRQMQQEGVDPDPITFVAVLNACASTAALEEGRRVHEQIIERGYESNMYVGNCLVDMYAKCGSIEDARIVFNMMSRRDMIAWNVMISGYAMHGYAREALEMFKLMLEEVDVDAVTFISMLSACSHEGLVEEGALYFKFMSAVANISPTEKHFACVVDLLGRAGHLHEAEDLIRSMPCDPHVSVWMPLLGACRTYRNVAMGERVAKRVLNLDPDNATPYLLLSNIYACAGRWDSSARLHPARL